MKACVSTWERKKLAARGFFRYSFLFYIHDSGDKNPLKSYKYILINGIRLTNIQWKARIFRKGVTMEKWVLKNKKADFAAMMKQYKISEVIARLLVNRNQKEEKDIEVFLHPDLVHLHNPLLMKDMVKACDILTDKIKCGKKIRIVGDYDVDGVASTYVLYTALKNCKASVDYEIPDRIKDGYGINMNIIEAASQDGIDTILTCDNGISAKEQIDEAKNKGMTVIITDHHDVPFMEEGDRKEYIIPGGDAVVNPKQSDCEYPFKCLCGAAVAFKLVQILYDRFGIDKKKTDQLLEVVAIATV